MTRTVVITPTAEANLDEIIHYIALDNPAAARRVITTLRTKMKSLAKMPGRCPLAPEDGLDGLQIRHLIHGNYRILFTADDTHITILQIRHAARLPAY
ncbi:MAG: hypothetical protein Tsb0016_08190 [Sphingomonadales bacterium]